MPEHKAQLYVENPNSQPPSSEGQKLPVTRRQSRNAVNAARTGDASIATL